eukprot:TRINITY_DN108974_c0_g1_i1.p1 TRINITY_DN108974_c0_g1~~TRINITY_DN108974_c0_g1_i1.p1  ORF type:complete len:343 (-),score=83.21 TRINITY_DN108974_c0_g1_i1:38-1066(-)
MDVAALGVGLPVLVGALSHLSLEDTLRCLRVARSWREAARQPEALVRCVHLHAPGPEDSGARCEQSVPASLLRVLSEGLLARVEAVELTGACSWFADVLSELPGLKRLQVKGKLVRPEYDAELALSSIQSVASRLEHLDFSGTSFSGFFAWPRMPALRRLAVRFFSFSLSDLSNLFAARELKVLELQASGLLESRMGVVRCGAEVQPTELSIMDCGAPMALTMLLSLGLEQLCFLHMDGCTDEKVQAELRKAARLRGGGVDEAVDAAAALQAQAEAELRAEIRRARDRGTTAAERRDAAGGPWRTLRRWLEASERKKRPDGKVKYTNPEALDRRSKASEACG